MSKAKYNEIQRDYIKENYKNYALIELTENFNKKFNTKLEKNQINNFLKNNKLTGRKRETKGSELFTKEQVYYIEKYQKGLTNKKLVNQLNKKFGLSITYNQMRNYKKNHGLTSGVDTRFFKGQKANEYCFKKGSTIGMATRFKKGDIPYNKRPVGSERINVYGYIEVKVSEPNKWRLKQIIVWESFNGPIPEGHKILFKDKNKLNTDINNLACVSSYRLLVMNKKKLIFNRAECTEAGIKVAKLWEKIYEKQNETLEVE